MSLPSLTFPVIIVLAVLWLFCAIIKIILRLTVGWCKSNVCLSGKTALVTGGSSGIGYQTALGLAARGCRVIIGQRSKCDKLKEEIIKETGNSNIVVKQLDLASLSSVREFARDINETERRLDILINNAMDATSHNAYSEDGLHMGMQTNHFGPFLLTHLLIGLLKKSAPSRIIFVSSLAAFFSNLTLQNLNYPNNTPSTLWKDLVVYGNAKLCNIITANRLSKKLCGTGVTANSLHPGVVQTPAFKKLAECHNLDSFFQRCFNFCFLKNFAKDAQEGAQTTLYLSMDKRIENVSGKFFSDCKIILQPTKAKNEEFCKKIWEFSEEFVKLRDDEKL